MFGRTPVTRWLGWLVRAQYLRIIPVEFRHYFYLRVEILGCTEGEEYEAQSFFVMLDCDLTYPVMSCINLPVTASVPTSPPSGHKVPVQRCGLGQFSCALSEDCVPVSVHCDGRPDCKDNSDEINCGEGSTHWFIHE